MNITKIKKKTKMEDFLKGIDFKMLKKQKASLLKVLDNIPKKSVPTKEVKKLDKDLTGILNLIDSIQEIAVDEYGVKEKAVFKLSKIDAILLDKKIYRIYERNGVGAACDFANEHNVPYKYCDACNAEMPSLGGDCCICGQTS